MWIKQENYETGNKYWLSEKLLELQMRGWWKDILQLTNYPHILPAVLPANVLAGVSVYSAADSFCRLVSQR